MALQVAPWGAAGDDIVRWDATCPDCDGVAPPLAPCDYCEGRRDEKKDIVKVLHWRGEGDLADWIADGCPQRRL